MTKMFNHPAFAMYDDFIEYTANGVVYDGLYPLSYSVRDPVTMFDNPKSDKFELRISNEPHFIDTTPVVSETVSTKKHQYSIKQHLIYWMPNGEPYIITPDPTIHYTRVGNDVRRFERGDHLFIPSMVKKVDLISIVNGCKEHGKDKTRYISVYLKRYNRV